jgi:hypothetical protein
MAGFTFYPGLEIAKKADERWRALGFSSRSVYLKFLLLKDLGYGAQDTVREVLPNPLQDLIREMVRAEVETALSKSRKANDHTSHPP